MQYKDQSNNELAHQILDKINKKLIEYESRPEIDKVRVAIWDANVLFKTEADTIENEQKAIYDSFLNYLRIVNQGENNINCEIDLSSKIHVIQDLVNSGYGESKKELMRAKYNTVITNQIFRLLNILLNNRSEYEKNVNNVFIPEILKNAEVLKVNLSMFMLHIIFENTKEKIERVIYGNINDIETSMDNLLIEYNNDSQLLGIILNSIRKDVKDTPYHDNYRRVRMHLMSRGYNGDFKSLYSQIRNASSHGEFYTDIKTNGEISIELVDDNGTSVNIEKRDLFNYLNSIIYAFPKEKKFAMFLEFYNSNNLVDTIDKLKLEGREEEALKFFSVLLTFNLVEYNYEQFLQKLTVENNPTKKKTEVINIKEYFNTSYDKATATNDKILETIKHSLGHINAQYINGKIIFENKKRNESCECSLLDLINFSMYSGIHQLDIATEFYQVYKSRVEKEIRNLYNIVQEEVKQKGEKLNYNNLLTIDNNIDNINKSKF